MIFLNLLSTSRYTQVHAEMKRCNDKEDDVSYPTTTSLHKAIMKLPEIPWTWRKSTTYDILMHLGFRQVSASFLSLHNLDIYQESFFHKSAIWALHVHSKLSGFGVPYFFLARRFSVPPLSTIQKFSNSCFLFFQLIWHFVSTQC